MRNVWMNRLCVFARTSQARTKQSSDCRVASLVVPKFRRRITIRNLTAVLLAVVLIFIPLLAKAENAAPVKLEISQAPHLGKNIYKVKVSFPDGQSMTGKLDLMYYLNEIPGEIFNDIDMPYSFNLSLNGVYAGTYQIKVMLEDESQRIIESNAVTVVAK